MARRSRSRSWGGYGAGVENAVADTTDANGKNITLSLCVFFYINRVLYGEWSMPLGQSADLARSVRMDEYGKDARGGALPFVIR